MIRVLVAIAIKFGLHGGLSQYILCVEVITVLSCVFHAASY